MIAVLLVLLSARGPVAQEVPDLDTVLERLDERRADIGDLTLDLSYADFGKNVYGTERWQPHSKGTFAYQKDKGAGWQLRRDGSGRFFSSLLDQGRGIQATLDPGRFALRFPLGLFRINNHPGMLYEHAYGASYFQADLKSHSPAILPTLARSPGVYPVILLMDLAPGTYLRLFPELRVSGKVEEEGRTYFILTAKPQDPADTARQDEARRVWFNQAWLDAKIWVDAEKHLLHRIVLRFEGAASAPRFTWIRTYEFTGREPKFQVPTEISCELRSETRKIGGRSKLVISKVRPNAGVNGDVFSIKVPEGRIVRDWTPQPTDHYLERLKENPKDAAAWLSLAAMRLRRYDVAGSEEAFRKVVESAPASPEGYEGLIYILARKRRPWPEGIAFLEAGVKKGIRSHLVHWELAHRYAARNPEEAKRHFQAVLELVGESPEVYLTMARSFGRDPVVRRDYCMRALHIELASGPSGWDVVGEWLRTSPTPEEIDALIKLHEEALVAQGDQAWLRSRILKLLQERGGRRERELLEAEALLLLFETAPEENHAGFAERPLMVFLNEERIELAERLETLFAERKDDRSEAFRNVLTGELAAVRLEDEKLVEFLNTRIKPPPGRFFRPTMNPGYRFFQALGRRGKLIELAHRLLETPRPDRNHSFHFRVVDNIATKFLKGASQTALKNRLAEARSGKPATVRAFLEHAGNLIKEERWKDARVEAVRILARDDATPRDRARAEEIRARCHEAVGEYFKAVAACDRSIAEDPAASAYALRAQALLAAEDPRRAVATFQAAFDAAVTLEESRPRWIFTRDLIDELRKTVQGRTGQEFLAQVEDAVRGREDKPGAHLVLAFVRQSRRDYPASAESFKKACALHTAGPVILRERLLALAEANQVREAVALTQTLYPLLRKHQKALYFYRHGEISSLNGEIVQASSRLIDTIPAREFAEVLAKEPVTYETLHSLARLLVVIGDEDFIRKIDGIYGKDAKESWPRFHAHYPAAFAYHSIGKSGKAVELYRPFVEDKTLSDGTRNVAKAWIAGWEVAPPPKTDPIAILRASLRKASPRLDEVQALKGVLTGKELWRYRREIDRRWREEVRKEKTDPLFYKIGAVRAATREDRAFCLTKLTESGKAQPIWSLEYLTAELESGGTPDLSQAIAKLILEARGDPARKTRLIQRLMTPFNRMEPDQARKIIMALAKAGEFRTVWSFKHAFLRDIADRQFFLETWQKAAKAGTERALASLSLGELLLELDKLDDAEEELRSALGERGASSEVLTRIENVYFPLLAKAGKTDELARGMVSRIKRRSGEGNYDERLTLYELRRFLPRKSSVAKRMEVARALGSVGAYRLGWDFGMSFYAPIKARVEYARTWRKNAKPGDDRADACATLAHILLRIRGEEEAEEALGAVKAGLKEKIAKPDLRRTLRRTHLEALGRLKDIPGAVSAISAWIREEGEDPEVLQACLAESGRFERQAFREAFVKAAEGAPKSPVLSVFRARLVYLEQDYKRYRLILEEAFKEYPKHPSVLRFLGDARMKVQEWNGAAEIFEALVAAKKGAPELWPVRLSLVTCYVNAGDKDSAVKHLRAAEADGIREFIARHAASSGLFEEAVRLYRLLPERKLSQPQTKIAYARALRLAGRGKEAKKELLELLKTQTFYTRTILPELFQILATEKAYGEMAKLLFEHTRGGKSLERELAAYERLSWSVTQSARRGVSEEWGKLKAEGEDELLHQLVHARMERVWLNSAARASRILKKAQEKWPKSLEVQFELQNVFRGTDAYGELGRTEERLAELDPEGKKTRITRAARHLRALRHYVRFQHPESIFRVGFRILYDEKASLGQRREAWSTITGTIGNAGEEPWDELGRISYTEGLGGKEREAENHLLALSSDDIEKRFEARGALEKMGPDALRVLLPAVDSSDIDLRTHAREIIRSIISSWRPEDP